MALTALRIYTIASCALNKKHGIDIGTAMLIRSFAIIKINLMARFEQTRHVPPGHEKNLIKNWVIDEKT